jgi:hypothetical protein
MSSYASDKFTSFKIRHPDWLSWNTMGSLGMRSLWGAKGRASQLLSGGSGKGVAGDTSGIDQPKNSSPMGVLAARSKAPRLEDTKCDYLVRKKLLMTGTLLLKNVKNDGEALMGGCKTVVLMARTLPAPLSTSNRMEQRMNASAWGLCKNCKWLQIEPGASPENLTLGLCIEERLQLFRLRVSGNSGCNRFTEGKPIHAKGSSAAPPRSEPQR